MGTWDAGPFDNDTAADFSCQLDEVAPDQRPALLRAALDRALAGGYLDGEDGAQAVAAAALVAAQCPGGEPIDPAYAPRSAIPLLGPEYAGLALDVLDRVAGAESELAELWADSGEQARWVAVLERLRLVLKAAA
ncbi:DUF4259 domain-containing protein [Kitasatospora sp. LaBMicrA B282]|uniref:DUF4259 domain-containing protein n=1 Tax=Kitasatospora sp. LaBMicrA B282 TaxID=3420949 RepID=UPI003D0B9057